MLSDNHLGGAGHHGPGPVLLRHPGLGDQGEEPGQGEGVEAPHGVVHEAEQEVGQEHEPQEDEDQLYDAVRAQKRHHGVQALHDGLPRGAPETAGPGTQGREGISDDLHGVVSACVIQSLACQQI